MSSVPTPALLEVLDAELARQELRRQDLHRAMADRFGEHEDTYRKRVARAVEEGVADLYLADRCLVALGLTLNDLPGYEPPRLRGSANASVAGYLTEAQVLACHRLYMSGLSLRAVAEQILPRTRYTTVRGCAESLRRRFMRLGLERRGHAEHLVTHGRARRGHPNRSEYVTEWKRAHGERPAIRCAGTKSDGGPCDAWAVHGETTCNKHRPTPVELRAAA